MSKLKGKNVFVSGADGFIGSHLVNILVQEGANVQALVMYNSWNEIGWLKELPKEKLDSIQIINGDIRDTDLIRKLVKKANYVFHLSSLIAIPYSYDAPHSYVETNINGALNILNAAKDSDVIEKVIHVSTSEVYGSAQTIPINETHPLVGQSPYSASKIAADKMAESFNLSFGLPVIIARPFNTYGPRQTARAVIPTIASQLASGLKEIKLGSISPTRDFNFVTDTAEGMVAVGLMNGFDGQVINIGSGVEYSIKDVFDILSSIANINAEVVIDESRVRPEKSEVNRLLADNSLIISNSNWRPKVKFHEGLEKTYNWISNNLDKFNVKDYAK